MYLIFNQSPQQSRHNGARGGRAFARNLRLRKLRAAVSAQLLPQPAPPRETAHEASVSLDRQFPWLAGAFAPKNKRGVPSARTKTGLRGKQGTSTTVSEIRPKAS